MQFWSVSVVPKYLNFTASPKDLFSVFMLCLCPACWHRDINIYLVFSGFASKPTSLLASNRAFVFFCMVSMFFSHYINVVNVDQKLMSPIQFQSFLILLDPYNGIFQSKSDKASPCFKTLWTGKECLTRRKILRQGTDGFTSPLRRKSCYGFLPPLKIWRPRSDSNPRIFGPVASTITTRPPRATTER
jgi:hypothetical protein